MRTKRMTRATLALLLTFVAFTAVAASNPADLAPRYLPSGLVNDPAIATDGEAFLAAWRDAREGGAVIRARRIQSSGDVTDFTGIILGDAPDAIAAPAVSWNGSTYVVAWRRGSGFASAVVSRDGKVLATQQHSGPAGSDAQYSLAMAWNGTTHIVVMDAGHRLYAMFVTPDGREVSRWFPIPGGVGQGAPSVASDGRDYLVAWSDFDRGFSVIHARRISDAGVAIGETIDVGRTEIPGTNYRSEASFPSVAWDGSRFIVLWTTNGVRARTIEANGALGVERLLAESGERAAVINGYAAWNVAHGSTYDLVIAKLRGDAVEEQTTFITQFAIAPSRPALAASDRSVVFVRPNANFTGQKAFDALFVDTTHPLTASTPIFLGIAAFGQYAPRVLSSDNGFLVTWAESVPQFSRGYLDANVSRNYAAPVAIDSTTLAPATLLGEDVYGIRGSRGAFAAGRYLIVWTTFEPPRTRTIGVIVDEGGHVLKAPFVIASHSYGPFGHDPIVVSDGASFYVIDYEEDFANTPPAIVAVPVSIDGTLGEKRTLVANLDDEPADLRAAMAFGKLVIVWHRLTDTIETIAEFTTDLQPLGTPVRLSLAPASEVVVTPDTTFIAGFFPGRNNGEIDVIHSGPLVRVAGLVSEGRIESITAAWTGTELVVAFTETAGSGSQLRVAYVTTDGEVRSIETLAKLDEPPSAIALGVAGGHVLLAYTKTETGTEYGGANRIMLTLDPHPRRRNRSSLMH